MLEAIKTMKTLCSNYKSMVSFLKTIPEVLLWDNNFDVLDASNKGAFKSKKIISFKISVTESALNISEALHQDYSA